jgi:hypothetical protein
MAAKVKLAEVRRTVETCKWVIRFWFEAKSLAGAMAAHEDLNEATALIHSERAKLDTMPLAPVMALVLAACSGLDLAAVEVVDRFGNGVVAYLEWP